MATKVTGSGRIRVRLLGDEAVKATFNAMAEHARDFVGAALAEVADEIKEEAERLVPVDTGALYQSIVVRFDKLGQDRSELRVSVDEPYAKFVEFGTIYQNAQPFLRPALEKNKGKILAAVEHSMDELAKDSIVKVTL